MFYRFSNELGFRFMMDKLALVPQYNELMMAKIKGEDNLGIKLMEVIVKCYTTFSPYCDIEDEVEREEKVFTEVFGEVKKNYLKATVFRDACDRYKLDTSDVDLVQLENTEYSIKVLLKDRTTLLEREMEVGEKRPLDDLEAIEKIGKSLKLLFDEKENLIGHIRNRVLKGDFSEGKMIGGKKMSFLARKNASSNN